MKKFISILLVCIMLVGVMPNVFADNNGLPFKDVNLSAWYGEAVKFCYEHGLMVGTAVDQFSPDDDVTRAMVCVVLWRHAGAPEPEGDNYFLDVPKDKWYTDAINWMYERGVAGGVGHGLFEPNKAITRQDMAAILYWFSEVQHYNITARETIYIQPLSDGTSVGVYKDGLSVSQYAVIPMEWCVGSGFITGTSKTTLAPKDTTTRSQLAMILYRYSNWVDNGQGFDYHWSYADYACEMGMDAKFPTATENGYVHMNCYNSDHRYYHCWPKGTTSNYPNEDFLRWVQVKLNHYIDNLDGWVLMDHETESYSFAIELGWTFTREEAYEQAKWHVNSIISGTEYNEVNYGYVGMVWNEVYNRYELVMFFG